MNQYELMGLSHSMVDHTSGFTILYLQDLFKEYPVSSIPSGQTFSVFLFIKDAFGNYTIDDLHFYW